MAKTLNEKLSAAKALVAKYEAAIAAEQIVNNVNVDNNVEFGFGRGDKRRTLTGTVVATKDDEKLGKVARIQVGEGFDAQFYNTRFADITKNLSVEAEGGEPEATDGSDPLTEA